jgi:hypothetical protein
LDTKRFAVTKWVMVKETCFSRSRLLVVEPHSRSTVPLAISGMRELGELELGFHCVDDPVAKVHGIADGLLLVVIVGERHRGFAVAQRDGACFLDLLERSGELLRERCACPERRQGGCRKQYREMHCNSPL